jgi:hypothetical protein
VTALTRRIHDNHNRIVAMRFWQFGDEVNTHDVPVIFGDRQGVEFAKRLAALGLCPKAKIARLAVLTDVS